MAKAKCAIAVSRQAFFTILIVVTGVSPKGGREKILMELFFFTPEKPALQLFDPPLQKNTNVTRKPCQKE